MRQRELRDSHHGLLQSGNIHASRTSLEEAYRSSSDSDDRLDDLELEALDKSRQAYRRNFSLFSKNPPWSSGYTYHDSQAKGDEILLPRKGVRRWQTSRKTCLLITLILALGLVAIVGSGALWVYKSAPPDGVGAT